MDATFERDGRGLLCREADGAILSVTPWGEDALRVRAVPRGDPPDERHALLDPSDPGAVEVRVGKRRASIRCGRIEAVAEADAWSGTVRLEFRNGRGETLLREIASGGPLGLRAHAFDPLPGGDWAVTASFEGRDGERIRGMGQYQEERIDWKGCELELAHRNGQASVPFLMSSLGYGFLWHQPSPGTVAFGANRTVWRARRARALDYWIAAGDTPAELSLRYARATGFPPLPPDRALGFWQSKLRYASQGELLGIAREFRRRGLPLGVLVCDYCHWPRLGDFRFDPAFFPDPAAMARELDAMGVSLATSVWPLVPLGSPAHGRARREGLLARPARAGTVGHRFLEDASFLDPTGPRARRRLWGKFRAGYHDLGVRHFFLDLAEPEVPGFDASAFRFHAGPGARMGNLYPQHYARLFFEGQRAAGQEAVANLVRSAWAGSQRYGAVVWSGDVAGTWEDFRRQVCAGICIGAAGIPWWTTDIGGFHGGDPEDPGFRELLVRWFQWAAYCPVMRLHGNRLPNVRVLRPDGTEAAASGGPNEPWSFGGKALRILAKYLRRREALRLYLQSLAREAHEFGRPLLRGMFYEFPDDPGCADLRDQHLLGARYLVAPVLEPGARSRRVALPASCCWRNVDTGEVHDGGRSVEAPAPLDTIPVFERL